MGLLFIRFHSPAFGRIASDGLVLALSFGQIVEQVIVNNLVGRCHELTFGQPLHVVAALGKIVNGGYSLGAVIVQWFAVDEYFA